MADKALSAMTAATVPAASDLLYVSVASGGPLDRKMTFANLTASLLPLAGGTLTGALIGTNADFVGVGSFRNTPASNITLLIGSESSLTSRGDSTNKAARIAVPHYLNAEEPAATVLMNTQVASNSLLLGGGSSLMNAATQISLYSAANNATVTGTEIARITSAGLRVQLGVSAAPSSLFHVYSQTLTADILRCSDSLGTVGIRQAAVAGVSLGVTSPAASGQAVVALTQNDNDEPFIDYVGTSEAGVTKNLSSFVTVDGAKAGWMRVAINGTDQWIPFYAAPVS